jgi:hypothetical protein
VRLWLVAPGDEGNLGPQLLLTELIESIEDGLDGESGLSGLPGEGGDAGLLGESGLIEDTDADSMIRGAGAGSVCPEVEAVVVASEGLSVEAIEGDVGRLAERSSTESTEVEDAEVRRSRSGVTASPSSCSAAISMATGSSVSSEMTAAIPNAPAATAAVVAAAVTVFQPDRCFTEGSWSVAGVGEARPPRHRVHRRVHRRRVRL